ncbi:hypothetical protein CPB86DRAFT_708461 [Serendipita vermifera]|nr:hypothetical protein CPB86DRAFT_708461 [Serendipita vermifera]
MRVLDLLRRTSNERDYEIWKNVVSRLVENRPRSKRVGVLDLSQDKQTEFVTTLLGPLTDEEAKDAITMRWEVLPSSTNTIHIKNGAKVARFGPVLEVPSQRLEILDAEIMEIKGIDIESVHIESHANLFADSKHAPNLLRTDVPIVITTPTGEGIPTPLMNSKNALILVNSSVVPAGVTNLKNSPESNSPGGQVQLMYLDLKDPDLVISRIKSLLSNAMTSNKSESSHIAALSAILDECKATVRRSTQELQIIRDSLSKYQTQVNENIDQVQTQASTIDPEFELKECRHMLERHLNTFKWFKFWEIDDIGELVVAETFANYGVSLERKLEWLSGSMASTQERIHRLTDILLQDLTKTRNLASLRNQVDQMKTQNLPIQPSTFTTAILHRRKQLAEISTTHLQKKYLRRVYRTFLTLPVMSGTPFLLWANEIISLSMAVPSALLGLVFCIRQISNGWEKGFRKWWNDYDIIQTGLADDIQKTVSKTVNQKLQAIPSAAIEKVTTVVKQQEADLEQIRKEIEDALIEVQRI